MPECQGSARCCLCYGFDEPELLLLLVHRAVTVP